MAWTTSSSGCEQMFSNLKRSPAELASSKGDTDRRLAVIIGCDDQFQAKLLKRAQALYGLLLASGRSRGPVRRGRRIDLGRKGVCKDGSKRTWLTRRRKAVEEAAAACVTPERRPPVELPESLAKEVAKQKAWGAKRKAEAFLEGTLKDSEATPEVVHEALQREKVNGANDRARHRNCVRVNQIVSLQARPQSTRWGLQGLTGPAFFLLPNAAEVNTCRQKLQSIGVSAFTQDSWQNSIK